jgi:hypothetical protein
MALVFVMAKRNPFSSHEILSLYLGGGKGTVSWVNCPKSSAYKRKKGKES